MATAGQPSEQQFQELARQGFEKGKKIFVHCAANKRVSTFVSLFGQARLGWSLDMAEACIRRVWKPNAAWVSFITHTKANLERAYLTGAVGRL